MGLSPLVGALGDAARTIGRGWRLHAALAVVLLAPAVIIVSLRPRVRLPGYAQPVYGDPAMATLVTDLLRGEQLVPPSPLPPAVFVTSAVERARPHLMLGRADRNWLLLEPDFRQRLLTVFRIMQERYGYHMVLMEGYRSPERQAELLAGGARVTRAEPGRSYHQYGLAADCAFYREGTLVIEDDTEWLSRGYNRYGEVARAAGLVWGGSWKGLRDLGHVELRAPEGRPRTRG